RFAEGNDVVVQRHGDHHAEHDAAERTREGEDLRVERVAHEPESRDREDEDGQRGDMRAPPGNAHAALAAGARERLARTERLLLPEREGLPFPPRACVHRGSLTWPLVCGSVAAILRVAAPSWHVGQSSRCNKGLPPPLP